MQYCWQFWTFHFARGVFDFVRKEANCEASCEKFLLEAVFFASEHSWKGM
jgi:hypothetical protein